MVSQSCWRPLSREAGNQFAPPHALAYSGAESPGRYFAAMVIFEVGWRERSSRAVVRPVTPPPRTRKDAGNSVVSEGFDAGVGQVLELTHFRVR
jgi:hypothetical protein